MATKQKPAVTPTLEKPKAATGFVVPAKGAQDLLDYLSQRPYHEVQDLVPILLRAEPVF